MARWRHLTATTRMHFAAIFVMQICVTHEWFFTKEYNSVSQSIVVVVVKWRDVLSSNNTRRKSIDNKLQSNRLSEYRLTMLGITLLQPPWQAISWASDSWARRAGTSQWARGLGKGRSHISLPTVPRVLRLWEAVNNVICMPRPRQLRGVRGHEVDFVIVCCKISTNQKLPFRRV